MNKTIPLKDDNQLQRKAWGAVLVQSEGFRCLAYKDQTGVWRGYFGNYELREPVQVIEYRLDC